VTSIESNLFVRESLGPFISIILAGWREAGQADRFSDDAAPSLL
jgi:hypothetical protein